MNEQEIGVNVVFRVDASNQIGTGHLVRCRTLALALRRRGVVVEFVCRTHPGHLMDWLAQDGIPCAGLRPPANSLAGGEPITRPGSARPKAATPVKPSKPSATNLPTGWSSTITGWMRLGNGNSSRIAGKSSSSTIWRTALTTAMCCWIRISTRITANATMGKTPAECQLLLGPDYALLRDEFREFRTKARCRSAPARRILVFFGGVDALNCTGGAIEAIARLGVKDIAADVVIGLQHPRRRDIEHACDRYGFACHVQTSRMAELMAAADLALGAGGSASWERCCLGLPSILTAAADNQIAVCTTLAGTGAADYLGEAKALEAGDWQAGIGARFQSSWLATASTSASSLVDGLGVSRTLAVMGLE